ncbi:MAG TPA: helix-turn-helix domain-containing protein [Bacteroidales bacterium]|nr:helix-turn-helix domain-containing protein [Bacteroidales bacterium]
MNLLKAFQYFAIAGFLNALLLSALLIANKRNHVAKVYMILLVILTTFQTLLNAFDTKEFFLAYPHLSKISWLIPSLFGPLTYLFTLKLCSANPLFKKSDLLHFMPFLVYLVVLLPWYIRPASYKREYLADFELAREDDFGFLNQFSILIILVYLVITLLYLKNFRIRISNTFSEISKKRVEWMSVFSWGVLIVLFVSALGFYGHKWSIPVLDAIYHYNYILIVLLVYWIGYKSLLQPVIFDVTAPEAVEIIEGNQGDQGDDTPVKRYYKSGLGDEQAEALYLQLIAYMKKNKPYLEPEINIFQLANRMNIKKHHLSLVINEKAGMNFFDFINSFRVEEIKQRMINGSGKNLTLLGIAFESGFNSKATFNNAFKKFTGTTPTGFQKSLKTSFS